MRSRPFPRPSAASDHGDRSPRTGPGPSLARGVVLLGRYHGSGYREPKYLIQGSSGQVLHVSRLLFLVAANLDGRRSSAEVAERVSGQYRRRLTPAGVDYLVEAKLRPLGLLDPTASTGAPGAPSQLLGLRLRRPLVPARAVRVLGHVLAPLFLPVVIVGVLAALVAGDLWLLRTASLMDALQVTLLDPPLILAVLGITVAAALVHELGHAAACTYGGGRPGAIGVGLYLVYPAFYTDVTDSYRLDRAGRVRTDLGGVLFNAITLVLLTVALAVTGWLPLVLVIVLVHVEMGQQLLPIVRLDGYYVLADLVGVPDLFARVRPILAGLRPGRGPDPRATALRRSTRIVVTVWVLTVVPLLVGLLALLLVRAPRMLESVWAAEQREWQVLQLAVDHDLWATAAVSAISLVLLALPVLGTALLLGDLARRTVPPGIRRLGRLYTRAVKRLEDTVNGPDHPDRSPAHRAGSDGARAGTGPAPPRNGAPPGHDAAPDRAAVPRNGAPPDGTAMSRNGAPPDRAAVSRTGAPPDRAAVSPNGAPPDRAAVSPNGAPPDGAAVSRNGAAASVGVASRPRQPLAGTRDGTPRTGPAGGPSSTAPAGPARVPAGAAPAATRAGERVPAGGGRTAGRVHDTGRGAVAAHGNGADPRASTDGTSSGTVPGSADHRPTADERTGGTARVTGAGTGVAHGTGTGGRPTTDGSTSGAAHGTRADHPTGQSNGTDHRPSITGGATGSPATGNGAHRSDGGDRRPVTDDGGPVGSDAEDRPPGRRRTADDFTEDTMLRPRSRPPTRGWRRAVYAATAGAVNPGPGAAERREIEVLERVRTRVRGARRIVVLSRKGGAGKTTTTLMLGHTFATHRGDRVVALDANPDAGSLAYRVRRETSETVTSLLAEGDGLERYSDVRAYTSQSPDTRLEVVASDDDPRISHALGERDYRQTIDLLDRHYNLILIDTGTGILDAGIQGILTEADQLVVVMPPALDGGRVAAMTLDWLDEHGRSDLVCSSVAVINGVHGRGAVELDRMEAHFAARCASTVRIPWDPALGAGAHTGLAELRRSTRDAYLELAATVAEGFVTSCRTAPDHRPPRPVPGLPHGRAAT